MVGEGKECTLRNICFSNSVSIIAEITSAGSIYAEVSNDTVNKYLLKEFLNKLRDFIKLEKRIQLKVWLILLDNTSKHL